jgi:large subunit ribosomal protein L4
MPTVPVYNLEGETVGEMELSERVFQAPVNTALLHQAVVTYLRNQRIGSANTKTRAEVRGGGRKPWRQKGTGRARQGSIRAPHWRGGGVVFGPKPRDYSTQLPQKMRQAAIRQALSAKLASGELKVVDSLHLPAIKTKQVVAALEKLGAGDNALLVTATPDPNLKLSARNLPQVETATYNALNAYVLLKHRQVVLAKNAVEAIEEVFGA